MNTECILPHLNWQRGFDRVSENSEQHVQLREILSLNRHCEHNALAAESVVYPIEQS